MRLSLAAVLLTLAATASALETETVGAAALGPLSGIPAGQTVIATSGQAIVRLSAGADLAAFDAALAGLGASRGVGLGPNWHLIALAPGQSVGSALPILRALPGVAAADPSRVYTLERTPNDPQVAAQYALSAVSAFAGWEYEVGTSCRTTIAIIDSGIQGTQPDLSGKLANTVGQAFDPDTGVRTVNDPPTPACNHATRVAGVAAATTDNSSGVAGMSWGAQLLSLKVFRDGDCNPAGSCPGGCLTNDAGVSAAINWAVSLQNTAAVGKVIINMSLGGPGACPGAGVVQTAINAAIAANVPVIVSAGNDGGNVNNPGNCNGVIPVGATDSNNSVASFSSRGTALANNGLVAPGVGVVTTDLGGATASATGTSFSAPMVAGLASLILSAKPAFTPTQVSAAIRGGADGIGVSALGGGTAPQGNSAGAGRMNAFKAMRIAVNGTLAGFDGQEKPIAFPNPFKPSTTGHVTFAIPPSLQGSAAKITVYTLDGQLVKELAGQSWDGKNANGTAVASGTYIFVVNTSAGTGRGRVSVLR